jgi:hypothetical protein
MSDVTIGDLDRWIEQLYQCKPLSEQEIKRLCEKVRPFLVAAFERPQSTVAGHCHGARRNFRNFPTSQYHVKLYFRDYGRVPLVQYFLQTN